MMGPNRFGAGMGMGGQQPPRPGMPQQAQGQPPQMGMPQMGGAPQQPPMMPQMGQQQGAGAPPPQAGGMPPAQQPQGPQDMDARRNWLMSQLASKQQGGQPGPGRMPTMDAQQMAGEAGRQASPPAPSQNPMAPNPMGMTEGIGQAVKAPMMRPNPAPGRPSLMEQSGAGGVRTPALPRWR